MLLCRFADPCDLWLMVECRRTANVSGWTSGISERNLGGNIAKSMFISALSTSAILCPDNDDKRHDDVHRFGPYIRRQQAVVCRPLPPTANNAHLLLLKYSLDPRQDTSLPFERREENVVDVPKAASHCPAFITVVRCSRKLSEKLLIYAP
ncbi:hypothetical protein Aduo_019801 [Ancylostoma duodenale]